MSQVPGMRISGKYIIVTTPRCDRPEDKECSTSEARLFAAQFASGAE